MTYAMGTVILLLALLFWPPTATLFIALELVYLPQKWMVIGHIVATGVWLSYVSWN